MTIEVDRRQDEPQGRHNQNAYTALGFSLGELDLAEKLIDFVLLRKIQKIPKIPKAVRPEA